jgi:hypothetical protein
MELTVIIPTRDRQAILLETLDRLEPQRSDVSFEVVVVDDGSTDGTADVLRDQVSERAFPLRVIEHSGLGPAVARNRAMEVAGAPVCLFMNDDSWPRGDLLARHRDFHRARPEREAALLGRIDLPLSPPPTPFMRWLAEMHFDYLGIEDPQDAGGQRFFTANVSGKTGFLTSVGGFDESFPAAAQEDIDLGLRLEAAGMRLVYDRDAVVEHCHPIDLPMAINRMRTVGSSLALLAERHADFPVPRRPGLRHRVKAGALTCSAMAGVRPRRVQRETWRFLCHEATREAYWSAREGPERGGAPTHPPLRIGRALARLASRDEDARMPAAA